MSLRKYLWIDGAMDGVYKSEGLISTDAALHKMHVQYYMKVRMLQCEYFMKCIYMEIHVHSTLA